MLKDTTCAHELNQRERHRLAEASRAGAAGHAADQSCRSVKRRYGSVVASGALSEQAVAEQLSQR
ncbi:hypothetical protein [uncultured Fibrella sp.]|uniref:hypothetical protein n=1 Tax=uncultured Fibrella sp. TaxID=1284596 RepID=UPI0035CA3F73